MQNLKKTVLLFGLFLLFLSRQEFSSSVHANLDNAYIRQVRMFDVDNIGTLHPVGMSYSTLSHEFLLFEAATAARPAPNLIRISSGEERIGSMDITTAVADPINMVFDSFAQRLLLMDTESNKLIAIKIRPDGTLLPATLTHHDVKQFNLRNPQGMAINPQNGHLFILDSVGPKLIRVESDSNDGFDNAPISSIGLESTSLDSVRGLAFDPSSEKLYLTNNDNEELAELTQNGEILAIRDMTAFEIDTLQGMVFAPSGDQTDDPTKLNLFIASSGNPSGSIIEFTLNKPESPPTVPNNTQATLIQTINANQWSPPSPDSAGIVYLPAANRLLISDSEVNEMPIYDGANLFESTLTGSLIKTYTTVDWAGVDWSDEPTGITVNPINQFLYVSDDNGSSSNRGVYEVDPGNDGEYATSDDVISFIKVNNLSSPDPEGVTFVPPGTAFPNSALFVTDGLSDQIYQVTPGTNGYYDGIPPYGDDVGTSFDTSSMGLLDPEGIAYNSDNGNLYIAGKSPSIGSHNFDTLLEVTTSGSLIQTIDVSAASAKRLSGLAYGPSSNNPNGRSVYIADRGVDNNSDPNENDGKIYEFGIIGEPEPTAVSPTVTIQITNTNDLELSWNHSLPNAKYQVWRSISTPYYSQGNPNWSMVTEIAAPGVEEPMMFVDTAVSADPTVFYIIKAIVGSSTTISNEVGKFVYPIIAAPPP